VAELGAWSDGEWVWHVDWRRPFFDWEVPLVEQLSLALLEARLGLGEVDRWEWKGEGSDVLCQLCLLCLLFGGEG